MMRRQVLSRATQGSRFFVLRFLCAAFSPKSVKRTEAAMAKGHLYREYREFQEREPRGFYATLMLAMDRADTQNLAKLKAAFPEVYEEMRARYNAPGGILPGDGNEYKRLVKAWNGATQEFARLREQHPDLAEYYTEEK